MLKNRLFSSFLNKRWRKKPTLGISIPSLPDSANKFIQKIPKAEIHLHFEGTIQAHTILNLCQKYDIKEITSLSDAQWCLFFDNPNMFFQQFLFVSNLLREEEDFYIAAEDLGKQLKADNTHYAEITIAPHKFVRWGMDFSALMHAIDAGLKKHWEGTYRYVIDIVRDLGPDLGMEMIQMVENQPHDLIVGIGLGGGENYPAEDSKPVFDYAASLGLRKTAHAGEGLGAASVWSAIRHLDVERLDHGVRSQEDETLVDYLRQHQIPLNMCPTSNVMLGVVTSIQSHPIGYYHSYGIPVNVSTDDPAFFRTTLCKEFKALVAHNVVPIQDIPLLIKNALHASFLPSHEKDTLLNQFDVETQALEQAFQPYGGSQGLHCDR